MVTRMGICVCEGSGDKFRIPLGIPDAYLLRTLGGLGNSDTVLECDKLDGTRRVGTPAEGNGNKNTLIAQQYAETMDITANEFFKNIINLYVSQPL